MVYIDNCGRLVSDELYHHGILGMHWGVRHESYPLESSEHTASEKKAGWKKSLDSASNGKRSSYKVGSRSSSVQRKVSAKKVLKTGAIVAGSALAGVGAYHLYNNHLANKMLKNGQTVHERIKESVAAGKKGFSTQWHQIPKKGMAGATVKALPGAALFVANSAAIVGGYKIHKAIKKNGGLKQTIANKRSKRSPNGSLAYKAGDMALRAAEYTVSHPVKATLMAYMAKTAFSTMGGMAADTIRIGKNVASKAIERYRDLHPNVYVPNGEGGFTKSYYTRK